MARSDLTDLTKLDFAQLKSQIKTHLENQDVFTDYDFEGSGLNVLLDVLAYNTHYNAMLSHLAINESFLDTAQIRANIVSHAQALGYIPKSRKCSYAKINLTVTGTETSPGVITLPRGFTVSGKINGKTYIFSTLSTYNATKLGGNRYYFNDVEVFQGKITESVYRIDSLNPFEKFEIPSDRVDMSTLSVKVFDNENTNSFDSYTYYNKIVETRPDSLVYFFNENTFGKYEVYFGDNYLGRKPLSGSKVVFEYIETEGSEANGIRSLSASSTIQGLSDILVSFAPGFTKTSLGRESETKESVKFNAPVNYATQERAVTADDYRVLILNNFNEVADVSVWGGEDNDPPEYGKVFIAPALLSQERLTQSFADSIRLYLKEKNVGAITPDIVEAEYTNVEVTVGFKYDTNKTNLTVSSLEELVRNVIIKYDQDYLSKFNGILRSSNLTSLIDNADPGIINSVLKLRMYKTFRPNPLISQDYTIFFPNPIYISATNEPTIQSSTFVIDNKECRISDEPIEGSEPLRRLFIFEVATGLKLSRYFDIGYIDPTIGTVFIKDVNFSLSNLITIYVKPDSFDLAPKYNQILAIPQESIAVISDVDTISLLGTTGIPTYTTFSRH
jgi:hypothetical protein